jgi:hypothetical protein
MTRHFPVTAPGMDQDLPVSPLTFNFSVEPPPAKAVGDVTVTITLNGTDSETASEYFNILGDDGSNLGQTELVAGSVRHLGDHHYHPG